MDRGDKPPAEVNESHHTVAKNVGLPRGAPAWTPREVLNRAITHPQPQETVSWKIQRKSNIRRKLFRYFVRLTFLLCFSCSLSLWFHSAFTAARNSAFSLPFRQSSLASQFLAPSSIIHRVIHLPVIHLPVIHIIRRNLPLRSMPCCLWFLHPRLAVG